MRSSGLAAAFLALFGAGCAGGGVRSPSPSMAGAPPPDAWITPPPSAPVVPIGAPAIVLKPAPPPDPNAFDVDAIVRVVDDARLAQVKAALDHDDASKAAQEMSAALATATLDADERAAWSYQLGRLRALSGDRAGAIKIFTDAAAAGGVLADFARLEAARALEETGQHDLALAELAKIPTDAVPPVEVDLLSMEALLAKGAIDKAAKPIRSYLAPGKHPPNWVSLALRFSNALLARPSDAHAEEALELARRVLYEATGGQGAGDAKDLEKKALATLPFAKKKALEHPTAEVRAQQAKSLVAAQRSAEALKITTPLLKTKAATGATEVACDLWAAHAEALVKTKKKPDAADAYGEAIARCAGQARAAEVLFGAGKASASAGRQVEAKQRFAQLEKEFPKHRLADDARLRGAKAALDANDEAAFTSMLATMPDAYPDGDMVNDGLFELALASLSKREFAKAIPILERGAARAGRERAYFAAGRFTYYLGRAHLETGATEQGLGELADVVESFPLSFYMSLASARLAERDPARLQKALANAMSRESEGRFTVLRDAWSSDARFLHAVALTRQGDARLARAELDRLGVGARTAPRELLVIASALLSKAGALRESHGLLRTATDRATTTRAEYTDWLEHYPVGQWRTPWELAFPRPYWPVVETESKRSGIPLALAYAIMREESAFEARVASGAKAYGLMQLIVPTATLVGKSLGLPGDEESLKKPEINIALGCRYLAQLRAKFPDNPLLAIPGYNAGDGAPRKWTAERPGDDFDLWVERIPYEETRLYTKRVMTSLAAYEFLYARDQASEALRSPLSASPNAKQASLSTP